MLICKTFISIKVIKNKGFSMLQNYECPTIYNKLFISFKNVIYIFAYLLKKRINDKVEI